MAPMLASFAVVLCTVVEPALHVTTAPHAARLFPGALLTQEQIEAAPVEALTVPQLNSEAARLADPPSLAAPIAMLAGGGGASLIFGTLTYLAFASLDRNQNNPIGAVLIAFAGLITGVIAAAGAVCAVIGGIILPAKMVQRDGYADRLTQVHARLAAVNAGQVVPPAPDPREPTPVRSDVARLEDSKPGLGFPIAFMSGGAGAALVGISYYTSNSSGGSCSGCISPLYLAIGLFVAAVAMEGIGVWQLISRLQQRSEIDEKIRAIEDQNPGEVPPPPDGMPPQPDMVPPPPPPPPPGASLPPLPLQFSFAFRF
ncbi:MAG TPA: hypothetical protein VFK87_01690 [Steroidobacteraceae bacterium]|nr:hypothetical protein [Steroidobacteraceae bacterium]